MDYWINPAHILVKGQNMDTNLAHTEAELPDAQQGQKQDNQAQQRDELQEMKKQIESLQKALKDTKAAYTRSQQKLKELIVNQQAKLELSEKEKEELEELKQTDPDKWYQRLKELEKRQEEHKQKLLKEMTLQEAKAYRDAHYPHLTDEILNNEVPPRLQKAVETGSISFEEYLKEVDKIVKALKVVDNPQAPQQPDLTQVPGGSTPDKQKAQEKILDNWAKITF